MGHLLRDSDAMTITIGSPETIGCREGRRVLADFYGELLGMQSYEPYGWLKLAERPPDGDYTAGRTTDGGSKLQLALDGDGWSDQRPPRWPDPDYPQQQHLDILVSDADAANALVISLGATLLGERRESRTYADPAGHPFCL
ncbi:MAG TPA: VOC family protein [Microlunatus sp.]